MHWNWFGWKCLLRYHWTKSVFRLVSVLSFSVSLSHSLSKMTQSDFFAGFGGQIDFLRGAANGLDGKGKPILALSSTTNKGESKIVPFLKPGSSVTATRAHVHYVVTEYGIANLFGRNLRQRAHALIQISHPDHRESLEKAAFERLKCMPSADWLCLHV